MYWVGTLCCHLPCASREQIPDIWPNALDPQATTNFNCICIFRVQIQLNNMVEQVFVSALLYHSVSWVILKACSLWDTRMGPSAWGCVALSIMEMGLAQYQFYHLSGHHFFEGGTFTIFGGTVAVYGAQILCIGGPRAQLRCDGH